MTLSGARDGTQDERIERAEDGGHRANADGDDPDGDDGKQRRARQRAAREPQVVAEEVHHGGVSGKTKAGAAFAQGGAGHSHDGAHPQGRHGHPAAGTSRGRQLIAEHIPHVVAVGIAEMAWEQRDEQADDHGASFLATARVAVAFTSRRRRSSSAARTWPPSGVRA